MRELIRRARAWQGVKWKHQGRSRQGVDCVGLWACVAGEMGRPISIPCNYTHDPDTTVLLTYMRSLFDEIPVPARRPGDFCLLRYPDRRGNMTNRHVAILTELGILHAMASERKVTETTLDKETEDRIERVFRMRRA